MNTDLNRNADWKKVTNGCLKTYQRMHSELYSFLFTELMLYTGSATEANEIIQTVFLNIWCNKEQYPTGINVRELFITKAFELASLKRL